MKKFESSKYIEEFLNHNLYERAFCNHSVQPLEKCPKTTEDAWLADQ